MTGPIQICRTDGASMRMERCSAGSLLGTMLLEALARDARSWRVRCALAERPDCQSEALAALADDEEHGVRWWVARNRATPPATLQDLCYDRKGSVASNAIRHHSLDPAWLRRTLSEMARSNDAFYHANKAAYHPQTPREGLERLARDPDTSISHNAQCRLLEGRR